MGLRKDQSKLTADERRRFVAAVLELKAHGGYDDYVDIHVHMGQRSRQRAALSGHMSHMRHMHQMPHMIHGSPEFLPWHREMLRRFEADLAAIDASVSLPYWNWTKDRTPQSSLWEDDFLGPTGEGKHGQVLRGHFAYKNGWKLTISDPNFVHEDLRRTLGVDAMAQSLPTQADVRGCLGELPYDTDPWNTNSKPSFRNRLEGWEQPAGARRPPPHLHNQVHVWVGGTMGTMASPNDPVFFLHHANIDRLWARWQAKHPDQEYLPASGGPDGQNKNDALDPWGKPTTIISTLDHRALGYRYDDER